MQNLYFTPEDIRILAGTRVFSDEFLDYLARYRFRGSMESVPEGTVIFPGEPVLTLRGGLIDAQLFESALCDLAGQASYIATKASRLARAAGGRAVFVRDGSGALHAGKPRIPAAFRSRPVPSAAGMRKESRRGPACP